MADEKVIVRLELSKTDLKKLESDGKASFKKAGESSGQAFSQGFGTAAKAAIIAATASLAIFSKKAIESASAMEDMNVQFFTFLKSQAKANALVKELSTFTAETPFQLEGVAASAKVLIAFGVEVDGITDRLKILGDISAGSGKPLKDLAVIFGQIKGVTKLTGERLNQLQEAGVNVLPVIGKQLGKSVAEVRKEMTLGNITFDIFKKALDSMAASGGLFEGGMKRLSQTFTGRVSTMKDNFILFSAAIGKVFLPVAKKAATTMSDFFKTASSPENIKRIITGIYVIGKALNDFLIAPMELVYNTFKIIVNGMKTSVQLLVAGVADNMSMLINLLPDSLVPDGWKESLNDFKESSREVLDEFVEDTNSSIANVYDGSVFSATEEALGAMLAAVEANGEAMKIATNTTKDEIKKTGKDAKKVAVDIGKAVSGTMAKGISSGIQLISKNLMEGKSAFADFGTFVINLFGDMAIQLGEMFILQGIAMTAFGKLSPGAAIAAGVALVAMGSIMKSFAGGGASYGSSGAVGGDGTIGIPESGPVSDETLEEQQVSGPRVTVNIQGDVLDSDETGLRIAELLNKAVDDSSVQIRSNAIA